KLLDAIAEVFRTWRGGEISDPSNPDGNGDLDLGASAVSRWNTVEEFVAGGGCSWRDHVGGFFQAAAAAMSDAGRMLPRQPSAEVGEWPARGEGDSGPPPAIEGADDLAVPEGAARAVPPPATAPEKHTAAAKGLAAGLVLAAVWQAAGTVRNAG